MDTAKLIENDLVSMFSATFGIPEVDIDPCAPLVELGADSLLLFEVIEPIQQRFGVKLSVRQFFSEIPTLRQVCEFIEFAKLHPAEVDNSTLDQLTVGSVQSPEHVSVHFTNHSNSAPIGNVQVSQDHKTRHFQWTSQSLPPTETADRRLYLQDFIPEYTRKTAKSKAHSVDVRCRIADSRSGIGFKPSIKEMLYPLVCDEFNGAEVRDIDGNNYVDMTMGFGAHLFGHNPSFVTTVITEQINRSFGLGTRNETALEVAELITEITGMDRVAFVNSGTEAVMNAVRVARAATRRDHIVLFATSYHGHWDAVLATSSGRAEIFAARPLSVGIPSSMVADVSVFEFGTEEALAFMKKNSSKIAAVLVEPVPTRNPGLALPDYLHRLRELTERLGILLIFDEIVTGFRSHPAGVQGLYGIAADIVTYGKTIGGGMPLGVIAGRGSTLDSIDGGNWSFGDNSYPATEPTFFGGTYFQHPLSMVAAKATLLEIKHRGLSLSQNLTTNTDAFVSRLNELFIEREVPIEVRSFTSFFRLIHRENLDLLYYSLLLRGVYIWEWRCWFLSDAHTEKHLDSVFSAFKESLSELAEYNLLPKK